MYDSNHTFLQFQRIRRTSEKTFISRDISRVQFHKLFRKHVSDDVQMELPVVPLPRALFDINHASLCQAIRNKVGQSVIIHVNQKAKAPTTDAAVGYPRDATEDDMFTDFPRETANAAPPENIDTQQAPEIDRDVCV